MKKIDKSPVLCILEKGFGGRAGGCLWYNGGLAGVPWKSPGYVKDFLLDIIIDDFREGWS